MSIKTYTPDYDHRRHYPKRDLAHMRTRLAEIERLLQGIPDGGVIPPSDAFVERLVQVYKLFETIDSALPRVGPLWVCGYASRGSGEVFWEWSGHIDRSDAELFLPMWKDAYPRDNWEIREGECDIGEFMPHGTDPAAIRKLLRR